MLNKLALIYNIPNLLNGASHVNGLVFHHIVCMLIFNLHEFRIGKIPN